MELIEINRSIHEIAKRYPDLIGSKADVLAGEMAIDKPEQLQASLANLEKKGRFLRIGIVGRVKSGKSSLLNALFFDGADILPKAATPMTAALTILTHGEHASAEVEYYTEDDISGMREDHARFHAEVEERVAAELEQFKSSQKKKSKASGSGTNIEEQRDKIRRRVNKELKETPRAAVAQQYEEIKSRRGGKPTADCEEIKADNLDSLRASLGDYVGASGRYTPFTKSITVKLPEERLRDIDIIDTPGINDPVVSREERTRALLSKCDVVYVISPSGQFMSQEDVALMDRISGREGVSELYLVNSKVDDQLQSMEEIRANNGILSKVLESINQKLRHQAIETLINVKRKFPEVGPCYDKIIDSPDTRVMHTSAICFTMARQLDNKSTWDEGCQHTWRLLAKAYPDFFPDQNRETSLHNLELLAGVAQVSTSLKGVMAAKGEIMRRRRDTLCRAKMSSLEEYRAKLIDIARERMNKVHATSIDDLDEKIDRLKSTKKKAGVAVDLKYQTLVNDLKSDILGVKERTKSHFRETKKEVGSLEEIKSESYEVDVTSKARKIFTLGISRRHETRTREFATVRTGAIANALEEMKVNLESGIKNSIDQIFKAWRQTLSGELLRDLRENMKDSYIDDGLFRIAIQKTCGGLDEPNIDLEAQENIKDEGNATGIGKLFDAMFNSNRRNSSILEGSEAEEFIDAAKKEIISLQKRLNRQIDNYANDLRSKLITTTPSADIFANYQDEIESLKEQIGKHELTTERINTLINELEAIDFSHNSPQDHVGVNQ